MGSARFGGEQPEWWHAHPAVTGLRPGPPAGVVAARRAHRRRRPPVAHPALGAFQADGLGGGVDPGLESCDGRSRALRSAWPDSFRPLTCRRHGDGIEEEGRRRPSRGRLPQALRGSSGMSAHRVRAITRRLLQQFRHDRRTLALLFGAPLIILGLLGYLLRGGGDVPHMGVVNLDSGPLGGIVTSALESSRTVSATTMSESEAASKLRAGEIAGYAVLPEDFSSRAQQTRVIAPQIHLEGSQPGLSQAILQAVTGSFAALAGQVGGVRFAPQLSYLYGGARL